MTEASADNTNTSCMNEPRARRLMANAGIDLLLANSVFNVTYLVGSPGTELEFAL